VAADEVEAPSVAAQAAGLLEPLLEVGDRAVGDDRCRAAGLRRDRQAVDATLVEAEQAESTRGLARTRSKVAHTSPSSCQVKSLLR
jgi:hypothetical protein